MAIFARASGPLSILAAFGLIATAGAKLCPRSPERAAMTWPPADQASHRLPSPAKAGVAAVAQARSAPAQGGGAECWCCAEAAEMPPATAAARANQAPCLICSLRASKFYLDSADDAARRAGIDRAAGAGKHAGAILQPASRVDRVRHVVGGRDIGF